MTNPEGTDGTGPEYNQPENTAQAGGGVNLFYRGLSTARYLLVEKPAQTQMGVGLAVTATGVLLDSLLTVFGGLLFTSFGALNWINQGENRAKIRGLELKIDNYETNQLATQPGGDSTGSPGPEPGPASE